MKDSRDNHTLSQAQIDAHIDAIAKLRPTHITVDNFMDWPEQFKMWVRSVRHYGIPIIYRLNWWDWQFFNNPLVQSVTATDYVAKTVDFIQQNIRFFRDGDIFDACPELEDGAYWIATYGQNRFSDPAMKAEYNQTLLAMFSQFQSVFDQAGLNIIANHCSHTPGSFTNNLITSQVAALHKWITCDGYPDTRITNPDSCVQAWLTILNLLHTKFPDRQIFISEMGYDLIAVNDDMQADTLRHELPALLQLSYIAGVNYWVGVGYEGHTELFIKDTWGAWQPRAAARIISSFFSNRGRLGRVPLN